MGQRPRKLGPTPRVYVIEFTYSRSTGKPRKPVSILHEVESRRLRCWLKSLPSIVRRRMGENWKYFHFVLDR